MLCLPAPSIIPNIKILTRHHIESNIVDWEFHELAKLLYQFYDHFNKDFFEDILPLPFITLDFGHPKSYGHYIRGYNGIGVTTTININSLYANRNLEGILTTLLHEMIHVEQEEVLKNGSGSNYHNKHFVQRSAQLGIPCNNRGQTLEISERFINYLKSKGIKTDAVLYKADPPPKKKKRITYKKFTCECGIDAKVAVELNATCNVCKKPFTEKVKEEKIVCII